MEFSENNILLFLIKNIFFLSFLKDQDPCIILLYWAVAPTACTMKLLEKMVNTCLFWFLEKASHLFQYNIDFDAEAPPKTRSERLLGITEGS